MLVKIEEIQEGGLELKEPVARAVLAEALEAAPDFAVLAPGELKVRFQKVSGQVHLKGAFTATMSAPCKRCVKPVELVVPVEFALRMVAEHREPEEDEALEARRGRRHARHDDGEAGNAGTFELDEVDAEPFDGKTIDLDPIVREQVLLALPVSVVCREDCKGLCGTCGQDLNEVDCGHAGQREVDPRLVKLKDITLKN